MIYAIITAAGKGTRLKSDISKQFIKIYGKPVLAHTIESFENCPEIERIFIVVPKDYADFCNDEIINKYKFSKVEKTITGGNTRQQSVYNALKLLPENCSIVAVHDGVRPLISPAEIGNLIKNLISFNKEDDKVKGVITAAPAYETVKKIDSNNYIDCTITRSLVCMAQTPQVFFCRTLVEAYKKAEQQNYTGTDDSSLVERLGWKVKAVIAHQENIKITTPLDLFLAELIIHRNGKKK